MDIQNSKPVIDAFTKKYPFIRGDLVRLGGTAMVSRIIAEAQAGAQKFDVAVGISPSYVPMREKNLIGPYLSTEFSSLYDDLYDPKGYWATVYLNTLVLGYNTKIISRNDLPKTYEDSTEATVQTEVHYRYRESRRVLRPQPRMGTGKGD